MWVQSTCASSATSASTSTDMWRTDGYLLRFEPCVLPKMSLFPCHHVVSDCVCVQRTLWFQTPFYCYCAHECATPQPPLGPFKKKKGAGYSLALLLAGSQIDSCGCPSGGVNFHVFASFPPLLVLPNSNILDSIMYVKFRITPQ